MRKAFSFLAGLVVGASVGAVVAILFAPSSGPELQRKVRTRVQEIIDEGKRAAEARRVELEAELEAFKRSAPVVIEETPEQSEA